MRRRRRFTKSPTWNPTDDQLLCRDIYHAWSPYTAKRRADGILRTLICGRCKAEKYQKLSKDGYILDTRMSYPPGYLRSGEGRLTKEDRAELRVRNS